MDGAGRRLIIQFLRKVQVIRLDEGIFDIGGRHCI